ncbi:HoxN/HupN/NixA family nickel/cobalt transporter [Microbacterium luticocti]|uniref:HoxN/HupN/NixA family nickel/cobalt transporter n=1 Tax=Microbacterium luticocti TaxID=451764 RepID=UPI001B7F823D|nr:HoxN/HupN/NixA family nickel/cobalt transporter [Microbacterium luticocti]
MTTSAPEKATAANGPGRVRARAVVPMVLVIIALFALGLLLLLAGAAGKYHLASGAVFGVGTGILALTLGMRHAFDADHIAAIDNTTRKLLAENRPAAGVGFFFSLGHSSVVFLMALLLCFGIRALNVAVKDDGSQLHAITGVIGTTVSGVFLYLIAIVNILIAISIVKAFRGLRRGEFDEAGFEDQLAKRGLMNRLFGRLSDKVDRPWKMYPIGFLFGLGFDTATEITLLVLSGAAVVSGLPWWAVLSLPLLFAAGMCLFDTADGIFMNIAYGWAFMRPARKVYYNLVITVLSVFIALVIGTIELLSLLADELGWSGPFWDAVGAIDLNSVGYVVVGLLAVTWAAAVIVWKLGRFEQRWVPPAQDP